MPIRPEAELAALQSELSLLNAYPKEKLAEIIRDIGFSCTCCGKCCTRDFNGHVFLLSSDARNAAAFAPEALMPAPDFSYSDNEGNFYVSGYALRTKPDGSCVFLSEEKRCTIYDRRFSICRIYPYMLHREPDARGRVDWRQISGLDEHGEYDVEISATAADTAAAEVIAYETAYLLQEIEFHEAVLAKFSEKGIRFVRRDHDLRMREFLRGEEAASVYVWNGEELCLEQAMPGDYR
ncbi:hypothetical protein McpSp1_00960 [Methanocorpusculaceae archaeon Sp1]|nr:hypothetical protein [Methanocorpusculaceae archaeon Sp1]